jgi:putative two-component system response regulator
MTMAPSVRFNESQILIVDDQQSNIDLLTAILRRIQLTNVATTTDSSRVVKLFMDGQPDLVILDLHMPAPNGIELIHLIRTRSRDAAYVPILVLTADASQEAKHGALQAGASDFLTKPLDPTEVRLRVWNLLEMRRLERRLVAEKELLEHRVQERTFELERARFEALDRLALAAEYRDDGTREHPLRVARTTELLARAIGVDRRAAREMGSASILHDIGKIAIPDSILLKPGSLEPDERAVMQTHATVGASVLAGSQSALLQLAEQIATSHHERWDGTGYPAGLAGEAIPLAGRIVAVADVFDALTHERPYKQAWPIDRAVAEVVASCGTHFDPSLVAAFGTLDHAVLAGPLAVSEPAPFSRADDDADAADTATRRRMHFLRSRDQRAG